MAAARDHWPLVGRANELEFVRGRLLHTQGVVLAGPAGVGKTRLGLECLEAGKRGRFTTLKVTASQAAAAIPFGALAPLLPAQHDDLAWTTASPVLLLRRSVAKIREQAEGKRLVLFVDDAHLLDEASATVVHQLAGTRSACLLLTLRVDEPCPDPITALWKDGLLDRLEVPALDVDAIEQLVTVVLGGPVDRGAVTLLAARSAGKALFLRELVLGALADGTLRDVGGIWQLTGPLLPSGRLIGLVEARLETLTAMQRELLEVVAYGEPIGQTELATFADPRDAEALERAGFLASRLTAGRVEFFPVHPVYGDVLRSRIPAARLATIARRLAEAVEYSGEPRQEDVLRIATWRLHGGGGSADLMLKAASMARWRSDFPLAERLAQAALDAGAGFGARLLLAHLAARQSRGSEAAAAFARLEGESESDDERGLLAVVRIDHIGWSVGDLAEGMRIAEDAQVGITDRDWKEEIAARQCGLVMGARGPAACVEFAAPLISSARAGPLAVASLAASVAFNRLGRFDEAIETAVRGYDAWLAARERPEWDVSIHLALRCDALAQIGRLTEAEELAHDGYRQALAEGDSEAQAFLALYLGKWASESGLVDQCIRYEREAFALFQQLGRPLEAQFCVPYLVTGLALAGRPEEAAVLLGEAAVATAPSFFTGVDIVQARAWVSVAMGDVPEARNHLREAVRLGRESGDLVGASSALHGLARIGFAAEVLEDTANLAALVEGDLVRVRLTHVRALASDDVSGLESAATSFESMGYVLLAAEAAAAMCNVWQRAGSGRQAASAHNLATRLSARLGPATTPGLRLVGATRSLTRAEYDIALLAAAGHSNQEIADGKGLSRRTIENHLHRVFGKLGVLSRRELKSALAETDFGRQA